MKMYSLKCPDCGANLDVTGDREFIFCTYCGHKIMIDESDETKLAEIDRQRKKDELEHKIKSDKNVGIFLLVCIAVLLIGGIILESIS